MKALVAGCTGYAGMILLRLLGEHPHVSEILPVSSSQAGEPLTAVDPGLGRAVLDKCRQNEGRLLTLPEGAACKPDVVLAALPHLKSADFCAPFFGNTVVLDLSADFRLKRAEDFFASYRQEPPRADLQDQAVYGLSEIYRNVIKTADLIACPGCYPTATLLPLIPLVKNRLVQGPAVVNALSGVSGAGRKVQQNYLYCERSENAGAYLPGKTHRHVNEIAQELDGVDVFFTPHLIPMKRGMAVTTMVPLRDGTDLNAVLGLLTATYAHEPFIRVRSDGIPQTGDVYGTNRCDMSAAAEGPYLYLFSVIDNLMKGAGGQAIQNMNIRFGFPEQAGLPTGSVL